MWINESVTSNTGVCCRHEGGWEGAGDGMLVYLINSLKEKQVLTCTNLFCSAEKEDRLAVSVDVC